MLKGVVSSDHVHSFVSVPPKLAISDLNQSACRQFQRSY
ncbi:hypothetical protein [Roseibium album]